MTSIYSETFTAELERLGRVIEALNVYSFLVILIGALVAKRQAH